MTCTVAIKRNLSWPRLRRRDIEHAKCTPPETQKSVYANRYIRPLFLRYASRTIGPKVIGLRNVFIAITSFFSSAQIHRSTDNRQLTYRGFQLILTGEKFPTVKGIDGDIRFWRIILNYFKIVGERKKGIF